MTRRRLQEILAWTLSGDLGVMLAIRGPDYNPSPVGTLSTDLTRQPWWAAHHCHKLPPVRPAYTPFTPIPSGRRRTP